MRYQDDSTSILVTLIKNIDQELSYNRIQHNIFTNTIQSGTVYRKMNLYSESYSTEFGWSRSHPKKKNGYAHETLSLFFNIYGVPPNMVMDVSKEQTLGFFRGK